MRVAIVGSRRYVGYADFKRRLKGIIATKSCFKNGVSEIVSGGARGVDTLAKWFASEYEIPITEYLPNYELYSNRAPLERNTLIVENSDIVIAFWDGKSRGTLDTINKAKSIGKDLLIEKI